MNISLIIATRNRCRQLARCLEAVERLDFGRPWELIVVDNGSTDSTAEAVHRVRQTFPVPLCYVLETEPGLGNAHNAGLSIARGEIVAFTDDDCYPETDFLTRIWLAFVDPSVGFIAGQIKLHDPADHPMTTIETAIPFTFRPGRLVSAGRFGGANMAFRRSVLVEIGGFDPLFGPGALFNAEDVDAAARASAIGWKGEYRPEVIVRHHHGRKAPDIPRLVKSYGIGVGAYQMKLLLEGRQFSAFARSVYQARRRFRWSPRSVLWEPVGAMKYACIYAARALRRR